MNILLKVSNFLVGALWKLKIGRISGKKIVLWELYTVSFHHSHPSNQQVALILIYFTQLYITKVIFQCAIHMKIIELLYILCCITEIQCIFLFWWHSLILISHTAAFSSHPWLVDAGKDRWSWNVRSALYKVLQLWAWDVAQVERACLACRRSWAWSPVPHKLRAMVHACNLRLRKCRHEDQSSRPSKLLSKFEAILWPMKSCLRKTSKELDWHVYHYLVDNGQWNQRPPYPPARPLQRTWGNVWRETEEHHNFMTSRMFFAGISWS